MNTDDPGDAPLRDLLDALRAEWQDESSSDDLPPESLDDCDVETQRSVGWLREAWALDSQSTDALPPVPVARAAARLSARRRSTSLRRRVQRSAATLVAVAAAVVALVALGRTPANDPDVAIDTSTATGTPATATDTHPVPPTIAPKTEFTPDQFRSRDDGVELVSGSVRLVLLTRGD